MLRKREPRDEDAHGPTVVLEGELSDVGVEVGDIVDAVADTLRCLSDSRR
jgi:hypothetical protein